MEEKKGIPELVLDLMDWKTVEATAETGLRAAMVLVKLHKIARTEAKKQIRSFGGKTSEEEKEDKDLAIKEQLKASTN